MSQHVSVLMGGWSAEREVSIITGEAVYAALEEAGYRVSYREGLGSAVVFGALANAQFNIQNNGFDFRQLDFEIDRYVIDNTTGNSLEQYIPFGNYSFNV